MPSTFFGLTVASSGLSAYQAAVNTTANNISNVKTEGYSRQEAVIKAAQALRVNQKYGTIGSGVEVTQIKQIRDQYYDIKYWESNSIKSRYETKTYYSEQIENYLIDDDTMKGFSSILDEMFDALDTLKTSTGDKDKRQQFISKAQNLVNYFGSIYNGFSKVQDDCNQEISTQVDTINSIGQKIASLNRQINVLELQGGYANELRDQRALLIDQLSSIVSVECTEVEVTNSNYPDMYLGGTEFMVKINGQTLVNSFEYYELECVPREYKVNQSDNDGLYDVRWKDTNIPFVASGSTSSGSLMALFELRDGNNQENFEATVEAFERNAEGTALTLSGASITDIKQMTMNDEGIIVIKNTEFHYTGFSYDADSDTYTFQLEESVSVLDQHALMGMTASIGTSIDAMGIPYYMSQMNNFLRAFCEEFNNMQQTGVDANGNDAGSFFVAVGVTDGEEFSFSDVFANGSMSSDADNYYRLTAANLGIASATVKDPMLFATVTKEAYNPDDVDKNDLIVSMLELKDGKKIFRGGAANEFLQCIISDNSVDTQKSKIFQTNYENLTNTIDNRRMSVSSVDEDDEAMDLLKFQNAYNLSAKAVQVLSEIYERLILQTGV